MKVTGCSVIYHRESINRGEYIFVESSFGAICVCLHVRILANLSFFLEFLLARDMLFDKSAD